MSDKKVIDFMKKAQEKKEETEGNAIDKFMDATKGATSLADYPKEIIEKLTEDGFMEEAIDKAEALVKSSLVHINSIPSDDSLIMQALNEIGLDGEDKTTQLSDVLVALGLGYMLEEEKSQADMETNSLKVHAVVTTYLDEVRQGKTPSVVDSFRISTILSMMTGGMEQGAESHHAIASMTLMSTAADLLSDLGEINDLQNLGIKLAGVHTLSQWSKHHQNGVL